MDAREVLHWLVDRVSAPEYERAGHADPADVHAAIDGNAGWEPPKPALSDEEAAQLAALQAKQQAVADAG